MHKVKRVYRQIRENLDIFVDFGCNLTVGWLKRSGANILSTTDLHTMKKVKAQAKEKIRQ